MKFHAFYTLLNYCSIISSKRQAGFHYNGVTDNADVMLTIIIIRPENYNKTDSDYLLCPDENNPFGPKLLLSRFSLIVI